MAAEVQQRRGEEELLILESGRIMEVEEVVVIMEVDNEVVAIMEVDNEVVVIMEVDNEVVVTFV